MGPRSKRAEHDRRLADIREVGVGCVAFKASDNDQDCPYPPVVVVHHPFGLPPERKCQYHLDVIMEFGPCPDRIEVLDHAAKERPTSGAT